MALALPAAAQTADVIYFNAKVVYTGGQALPKGRSLAVAGDRILAVGDDLAQYARPTTVRVDLKGATVVPGLIDSHGHMRGLGGLLESRDLRHVATVEEIAAWVKQQAAGRAAGEWITGRNWDQTNWGGRFPAAADLDKATTAYPVYLARVDGHAAWINTKAMELAGITDGTPDPPGGKIIRDAAGHATGVLVDGAMGLAGRKIPPASAAQVKRQLELAAQECSRLGLTGVHDAGVSRQEIDAYRQLIAEKKLPLRVYAMIGGSGALWREWLAKGPETGEYLTVRAIKMMADGALGSRGAAMWQGYTDEKSNTGLMMLTREQLEQVARDAAAHGFQAATHAIGDKANRMTLEAYAAALGGKNDKRFRIEHAQVVSLPDFRMFADYSVIASMQATHATSDMRWAAQRLGPDRVQGAYAWRRFLALGVPVANGSDFPVEEPDPLKGFYASVTRQDANGQPPGGWMPDQMMTREEALASWTVTGAYAAFEEKIKGTLEPGKLADFVVLDRDIMTAPAPEILRTKVLMTVLGGQVVHRQ
jgi:hypothetical protein